MDDDDVPVARRRPLNPTMLLALGQRPADVPEVQFLSQGYLEGRWSEADMDAYEALGTRGQRDAVRRHLAGHRQVLPEPSPERRRNRPRQERLEARRVVPGIRYVRRHSLDPILDARLSSGACRTLTYLIARCGKGLRLKTVTTWIAQALAVTTKTIQNHYRALEAAGYVLKSRPDDRGCTTLYLTPACEPPAFKKSLSETRHLADFGAKKSSHIQPTRKEEEGREGEGSGDDQAGQVSVAGSPPVNPVAELVGEAPPPDCPTVESMPPEPLRDDEGRQRPGDRPRGVFGEPKALSAFDQEMAKILGRMEDAFRERKERPT